MSRKEAYMSTFTGYPNWDESTKAEALETMISAYAQWLAAYSYEEPYNVDQRIDDIRWMIESDLALYQDKEEYEICTILRDALDIL